MKDNYVGSQRVLRQRGLPYGPEPKEPEPKGPRKKRPEPKGPRKKGPETKGPRPKGLSLQHK